MCDLEVRSIGILCARNSEDLLSLLQVIIENPADVCFETDGT